MGLSVVATVVRMDETPKDDPGGDGQPDEEIRDGDDELTRPLRVRKPTMAPPPAPAGLRPQAPPSAPVSSPPKEAAGGDAKRRRKPTMAPPPAPAGLRPQAPPTAPAFAPESAADRETTRRHRKPTLAPPPAPAALRPQAPPTAPAGDPARRLFEEPDEDQAAGGKTPASLRDLSEPAQALLRNIADCVPVDSSYDFSQRITEHLATYWTEREEVLVIDEAGQREKDYAAVFAVAKSIVSGQASDGAVSLVEEAKSVSDELDATSIGYYARELPADELRVVQSFHDLAVALMFYKVSFHVEDEADRMVMLASSMGAQGALQAALDWFVGLGVPEVISTYASLLEFKIDAEARRGPR